MHGTRFPRRRLGLALPIASALLGIAPTAGALPYSVFLQNVHTIASGTGFNTDEKNDFSDPVQEASRSFSLHSHAENETASGLAYGDAKALGTVAIGRVSAQVKTENWKTDGGTDNGGAKATITRAGWHDTLTLAGTPGTSTFLQFTLSVHANMTCAPLVFGGASLFSDVNVFEGGRGVGSDHSQVGVTCDGGTDRQSKTFFLQVAPGQEISVESYMQLTAEHNMDIDATSTGTLFIDLTESGFSLGSQSGHDYATNAVPEPGTLVSAGLGLVALGMLRRRA